MREGALSDQPVVVGVDAGGSHTRAVCVGIDGTVLGRGLRRGGSPNHNDDAQVQVRGAISDALETSERAPSDVRALTAGIAGFENDNDETWAAEFTGIDGIDCPRTHVNDAVVAHAGAFATAPGIIVIAGTGSMIMGVTETGRRLDSGTFRHYAGGARHLSFDAIHRALINNVDHEDEAFLSGVLKHWNLKSEWSPGTRAALHDVVVGLRSSDYNEVKRQFGQLACLVTEHATSSPLAKAALGRLVDKTRVGVELVAGAFEAESVAVCVEGGLGTSPQFTAALAMAFRTNRSPCTLESPQLGPVEGAALMAIKSLGRDEASTVTRLRRAGREPR